VHFESIGGFVDIHRLVQEIDAEISRLQQARALLAGEPRHSSARPKAGGTKTSKKTGGRRKRRLSAEGRKRIADAMRKRWAERRKQQAKQAGK
jgi:hypothetical protein